MSSIIVTLFVVYQFLGLMNLVAARFDIQCGNDSQVYPDWIRPQVCFQQQFHDMYMFGDSYSDNGQPLKNWRYYQDHFFPERNINGPTCTEYFSKLMGSNLYDYAFSGAPVDNVRIVHTTTQDIHQQLELLHQKGGPTKPSNETLYVFWIGTNDVYQTFEKTQTNAFLGEKIIDSALASLYTALETLYHMPTASSSSSVKNILVMGLVPIDHMPLVSNLFTQESQRRPMTDLVARYNNGLKDLVVGRFHQQYPEARISFYNTDGFVNQFFNGSNTLTFTDVVHPCSAQNTICSDETKYFWWDNIHPTTAASYLIAKNMHESLKFNQ